MKKSGCIMSAAKEGNVDTLKSLLSEKQTWLSKALGIAITANIADRDGWRPLHFAAQNGKVAAISFLLETGANVDSKNKDGATPLHLAAQKGEIKVVSHLLKAGANIKARDKDQKTPLYMACSNQHLELFRLLLQRGERLLASEANPLLTKVLCHDRFDFAEEILSFAGHEILTSEEANPLLDNTTLVHIYHKVAAIQWLLEKGANPRIRDASGNTALHNVFIGTSLACAYTQYALGGKILPLIEITHVLLQAGADADAKNKDGESPLDILKKAPQALGLVVQAASDYAGARGQDIKITGPLPVFLTLIAQVQSILECHIQAPSAHEFVAEAITKPTSKQLPFSIVPTVIREIQELLRKRHPSTDPSVLVQQVIQAFRFSCPTCGMLNPDAIYLAAAGSMLKEMNPQAGVTFAGPNVATLYCGRCPQCQGLSVEVSFDPEKLDFCV